MLEHCEYILALEVLSCYKRTHVEKGTVDQELKSSKNKGE